MNFDKSINSVFKFFIAHHKAPFVTPLLANAELPPLKVGEDILYEVPRALQQINKHISETDFLKKMKKAAKQQVLEYQEAHPPKINLETQNQTQTTDGPAVVASTTKRKLSPRTVSKIKDLTSKKVLEFKQDIIRADDLDAMKKLTLSLKALRMETKQDKKHIQA
jgi:hypothetical protein